MIHSTMMTAPSTIIPKSSAPRLIKLPPTPKAFIIPKAKSMASGMTDAATNPARILPKNSMRTNITMSKPSTKFSVIVNVTRSTNCVRSMNGSMTKPLGKLFCTWFMRSFTFLMTCWKFSPLSISVIPLTTSPSPLRVTAP